MVVTYICMKCGSVVVYHTDTARVKAPKKCKTCSYRRFKKLSDK